MNIYTLYKTTEAKPLVFTGEYSRSLLMADVVCAHLRIIIEGVNTKGAGT